jgi:transcriptional regulator GlxA family with amidase domain
MVLLSQGTNKMVLDLEELLFKQSYSVLAARIRIRPPLGRALDLIEAEYNNPDLTVRRLALAARLSKTHFGNVFRQAASFTPYQFVIRYRIMKAAELIKAGDRTLLRIAMDVGFGDSKALDRNFSKLLRVTPKDFLNFRGRAK